MLSPDHLDRLTVILIRARNPNNIGAVARAMHDFGFSDLRIVNDFSVPFQTAKSAVDASQVLAAAREFSTLAEAVADCTLIVGTTAVGGRALDHPLHELPQAGPLLRGELAHPQSRVALLFGSEKTGLSNDELSHCRWLLTIPMRPYAEGTRHVSMNLGQAAAVCLYELVREATPEPIPAKTQAPAADLDRLDQLLANVFERSGYTHRHPANSAPAQLRRLTRRMALSPPDATVWMGMLRQVLWKLNDSPSSQP